MYSSSSPCIFFLLSFSCSTMMEDTVSFKRGAKCCAHEVGTAASFVLFTDFFFLVFRMPPLLPLLPLPPLLPLLPALLSTVFIQCTALLTRSCKIATASGSMTRSRAACINRARTTLARSSKAMRRSYRAKVSWTSSRSPEVLKTL